MPKKDYWGWNVLQQMELSYGRFNFGYKIDEKCRSRETMSGTFLFSNVIQKLYIIGIYFSIIQYQGIYISISTNT